MTTPSVGPYRPAVRAGDLVFTSGQIPLDPKTGEPVPGGIAEQTERALDNLEAALAEAGASLADVVQTTVYLADMADFEAMNDVYARRFGGARPARSCVAVAGLPKGVRIEVAAIARVVG